MKHPHLVKRRLMTLLEIMIVIAVIAIATGTIGFGVSKAVVNQQFQTELSVLVDELRLAQNLMIILGTDVHVKFKQVANEKITYWIETETDLPKSMALEILRKHHELKVIKAISFKDDLNTKAKEGELDLQFLSHGNVMSKGIITLSTTDMMPPPKNVLQGYICLAGYPKQIASFSDMESAKKDCESTHDEHFDKELTFDTLYKNNEIVKPKEVKKENKGDPI
jgi:type II secretory pathway pseudopilin PulG